MKRSIAVGAAIASMLLTTPAVLAADEDIVVFGGEFEQPAPPAVEPPPTEQPSTPPPVVSEPEPPSEPVEEPLDEPPEELVFNRQPVEPPSEPAVEQPSEPSQPPVEQSNDRSLKSVRYPRGLRLQPLDEPPPTVEQPSEPPSDQPSEPVDQPVDQPTEQPPSEQSDRRDITAVRYPIGSKLQPLDEPPSIVQPIDQPIEQPSDQPIEQPSEQPSDQPSTPIDRTNEPMIIPPIDQPIVQPPIESPVEIIPLVDPPPSETSEPIDQPPPTTASEQPSQPIIISEPLSPVERNSSDDELIDIGTTIPFDSLKPTEPNDTAVIEPPPSEPSVDVPFRDLQPTEDSPVTFNPNVEVPEPAVDDPFQKYVPQPSEPEPSSVTLIDRTKDQTRNNQPQESEQSPVTPSTKKGKKLKARFVKLASDDTFDYYLDQSSVQWQRLPYSSSEYMADVWVRMLDRAPEDADLPSDLYEYVNDTSSDEISEAAARGVLYDDVDVKVLRTKRYFLEHYYIRPQTRQIQFLCELEVIGRPQNTISERAYNYKNWENLIPGSVESEIYSGVLAIIGKSKASSRGHMTGADMIEEYARISIR